MNHSALPVNISMDDLRTLRMRSQCLAPRRPRTELVEVVKAVVGVNAQLPSAMALSLRARLRDLTIEDLEASRVGERAVVRTWCMRGTLHLLAKDDLDWLLSAITGSEIRAGWRWLDKRAGLSREQAERVLEDAVQALKKNGPMTRPELMAALAHSYGEGIETAAAGVVHLNGLLGRACFGPDRGPDPTYVALDDWLDCQVKFSDHPDVSRLVWRYLQGYGPAGPQDLAAWWGLPLTQARQAFDHLRSELFELDLEGKPLWMLAPEAATLANAGQLATVHLLPAFDTYLLGYRNRDFAVPPGYQDRVFHGGQVAPVVIVDGLAAGTWRYERRGSQFRIKVMPFSAFMGQVRDQIAEEADDIGRFLGLKPALSFAGE